MIHYYIYGLYKNNKLIYVGRSFSPYARQNGHRNGAQSFEFDYCKILDKEEDLERKWIFKSLSEGAKLFNKIDSPNIEDWQIGDIVYFKN